MLLDQHRCSCGNPLPYNRTHTWDGVDVCEVCHEYERQCYERAHYDEMEAWDLREHHRGLLMLALGSVLVFVIFGFAAGAWM